MPYPQNFETAKELEVIVRKNGAVPATIAILDGVPCIGVHLRLFFSLFFFIILSSFLVSWLEVHLHDFGVDC